MKKSVDRIVRRVAHDRLNNNINGKSLDGFVLRDKEKEVRIKSQENGKSRQSDNVGGGGIYYQEVKQTGSQKIWIVLGAIVGLMVLLYSFNLLRHRQQSKPGEQNNMDHIEKQVEQQVVSGSQKNKDDEMDLNQGNDLSDVVDDSENDGSFHIYINREGFNVDTKIIEGSLDTDLHKGVVHQRGSAFPADPTGNVVITGHRWYPGDGKYNKVFFNMDKLQNGDQVIITYNGKRYVYRIEGCHIVDPKNTSLLNHTSSEAVLTLYTCHPRYYSKKRLVCRGVLDGIEEELNS